MTVTTAEILEEAGQILADPTAWLQGRYSNGAALGASWYGGEPQQLAEATCFCSLGAIREAYRRRGIPINGDANSAAWALEDVGTVGSVNEWNDHPDRQHSEIVEMFRKARDYAIENGL
ncbi:hypothetical protein [Mycobacterium phage WXIN]|nr:hypothetical protein [Mycobacterium phage WXIN]